MNSEIESCNSEKVIKKSKWLKFIPYIISFIIVSSIFAWLEGPKKIQFGLSRGENGTTLENITDTFHPGETMCFKYLMGGDGNTIQLTIERIDVKQPFIYYTETKQVPVILKTEQIFIHQLKHQVKLVYIK